MAGRPHGDGDRQVGAAVAWVEPDLERLLDHERIVADPHLPGLHLSDTPARRAGARGRVIHWTTPGTGPPQPASGPLPPALPHPGGRPREPSPAPRRPPGRPSAG